MPHKGTEQILKQRYLWEWDFEEGTIQETPEQMILRVAKKVASAFLNIKKDYKQVAEYANDFYGIMSKGKFIPSSPQLFNAMRGYGSDRDAYDLIYKPIDKMSKKDWDTINEFKNPKAAYGSCYAMGRIGDSIDEIYDALKEQAVVFKSAGGYGVSFSDLRSEGSLVSTTMGESCGPVEFMDLFNSNTQKIALSGKTKRGANMFSMAVSHPDIEKFISRKGTMIKDDSGQIRPKYLEHVNISVEITDAFMDAVENDKDWNLIDPHTTEVKKTVKARELWDLIIDTAYKSADPGLLMIDNINKFNPLKGIHRIKSVNPCVTGDTLVPTNKGLIRADQLEKGMLTWNPIKKQMDKITKVFNNGLKDIYKITLTNGMELKATKEHKLKTKSGDLVAVEYLSSQDILEISLDDTLQFVENGSIPEFEQENFGNKNLELKKFRYTNDVDMAWLIGVMVGDGTINADCKTGRHSVTFTIGNTKNGVKTNIERILNDMEVNYRTIETPTSTTQFVICSKNFCRYIAFLMEIEVNEEGKTSTKGNKKLPSWLFKSSKDIVLSFLAGLIDSDGTVNITKKGSNIAVSSVYKVILDSTQQILLSFGIKSLVSKMHSKRDMKDPRNGRTYKAKETWRITFSTLNKKALAEIYEFMYCSHKKENMKTCIDMGGPNSEYYIGQSKFAKIKSVEHIGQDVVYDITVPDDYMWVTNGFVSLDCSEYTGHDKTVCNLGSINLYALIQRDPTKPENGIMLNYYDLETTVEKAVIYLNLALMANDYPLEVLTQRSLDFRPIGLGFMGLASVFMRMGYEYGSEESLEFTKDFIDEFVYYTIKASNKFYHMSGIKFKDYDKSDYAKGIFHFTSRDYNAEISDLLKDGITNSRLIAIAPTGSISMIAAYLTSNAASVSGGIEPVFSLNYTRKVNPNTDQEFVIDQDDIAVRDTLKAMGHDDDTIRRVMDGDPKAKHIINNPRFKTAEQLDMNQHLNILNIVSNAIDMSVSKTINLPANTSREEISDLYKLAYKMGLKGITIFREGSRQAVLKDKAKDKKKEMTFDLGIDLTPKGKIKPKERPIVIQALKKTVHFKDGEETKILNIEIGFDEKNDPFEVFIRASTSTKDYSELFNSIGRLLSLSLRSGIDVEIAIKQIKKIKNWRNEYSPICQAIAVTVEELVQLGKAKTKKKQQEAIDKINKQKLITTEKGYLVDTETGEAYCPVCGAKKGEGLTFASGCINCACGWSACA